MPSLNDISATIVEHSRLVIAVMLLSSLIIGSGVTSVEREVGFGQFQSGTDAGQTASQIESNFSTAGGNTTQALIVVRGENVLSKQELVTQLETQRALRQNETVNDSLAGPPVGVANVIATTAILEERGANLQQDADALNETIQPLADRLNRTRKLQHRYHVLNESHQSGEIDDETYRKRSRELQQKLNRTIHGADENLTDEQEREFHTLTRRVRDLQRRADRARDALQAGKINQSTYLERVEKLQQQGRQIYFDLARKVYDDRYHQLQQRKEALLEQRKALLTPGGEEPFPPLTEQINQLRSMNESEINRTIRRVLGEDPPSDRAFLFMAIGYEPGNTTANATMIVVPMERPGTNLPGTASERLIEAQTAMRGVAERHYGDGEAGGATAFAIGDGIINAEIDQSMVDTLLLLAPLALLFVFGVLTMLYRDPFDIAIGLAGIGLVLLLTFGFMGWVGINLSPTIVIVPILLIGLTIDYANHVVMRYREERAAGNLLNPRPLWGPRWPMTVALAGVGGALLWVTTTTAIGFSASAVSPAPPLQKFGVVAATGILFALLVFGTIVPALKVEVDEFLEARGYDRQKAAIGTGGGPFNHLLVAGARLAERAPWQVVVLAFLLGTAGVASATQIDTSFQQEDFLATSPAPWMYDLPEPFAPDTYSSRQHLDYVGTHFIHQDTETAFLVTGNVTDPATLDRIQRVQNRSVRSGVAAEYTDGDPAITSALTVMETVAAKNESFNRTLRAADTDGDGVPDRNVTGVYAHLFEVAPERAGRVIAREDGEYQALQMTVAAAGGMSNERIAEEMRTLATIIEDDDVSVALTGQPILFVQVQNQILETVLKSLAYTLGMVAVLLIVGYRRSYGSGSLGAVTLIPVVLTLSWILGSMVILDIPFNVMTGLIASITLGLGVDYTIHVTERFNEEREDQTLSEALEATLTGTGGALLGSALTTAGGFAILTFGLLPPMKQFGIITGLTILYSFVASVFVLPSMLVLWHRYVVSGSLTPGTYKIAPRRRRYVYNRLRRLLDRDQ